ncbi:Hypothetical protein NATL1_17321 [Prochlorococcus marinus str. NATL1A]|uniref:Uncharacterized protein n=1 Tax=Prochlorococcus marinus (strain NATL1A) TaxID=167555 RepID=A2C478_PROM1|nr:Hypothetical protein NATL1_17321 [Prochlorococcus marinus str. NATL1A]
MAKGYMQICTSWWGYHLSSRYTNPNKWSLLQTKSLKINKALVKNEKQA